MKLIKWHLFKQIFTNFAIKYALKKLSLKILLQVNLRLRACLAYIKKKCINAFGFSSSSPRSASGRSISLGVFGTSSTSRASTGKSAVEMLEASKSLYVKSAQVRERKQEPTFSGVLQVTSLSTGMFMGASACLFLDVSTSIRGFVRLSVGP